MTATSALSLRTVTFGSVDGTVWGAGWFAEKPIVVLGGPPPSIGTTVQTVERFLEDVGGLVPGISNRASGCEIRIEIPSNHDSGAGYGKPVENFPFLLRVHDDYEVGTGYIRRKQWTRSIVRQIDASSASNFDRKLRNCAITSEESRRADRSSGKRALQYGL